ncbi:conserved hypothetical protein [Hyella patelloides LEGE 07179]|uniref:DUF1830 domain-containing protein n=1 Tax=Hyella patelloides LEGE 07179 TaxID=945734 RepID=A0A563VWW4_9CYAN|nr:DUF1830 domain-containing protein [Hyella patelloides]VEP15948.1 conserved hypothetical protein [Hyella patelloides LEGE 07179]
MISTSLPQKTNFIICSYVNVTSTIQIARIANIEHWYLERVIFPGQRLIFEAPANAIVEIYTSQLANAILAEKVSCQKIAMD